MGTMTASADPSPTRRFSILPFALASFIFILCLLLIYYHSQKQRQLDILRAEDQRLSDQLHEAQRRESYRLRESLRCESGRALEEQARETDPIHHERPQQAEYSHAPQQKGVSGSRSTRLIDYGLDYEQAFLAETSKIRLNKIDEVLETINRTEFEVDRILKDINRVLSGPPSETDIVDETSSSTTVLGLVSQQEMILKKNKYWLGEEMYNQLLKYHSLNAQYVTDTLIGPRGTDLGEVLKARERVKDNILQLRRVFLDKEYTTDKSLKRLH